MADPARTLSELLTPAREEDASGGRYRLQLPETWHQGKGLFGGLSLGALAAAVLDAEPEKDWRLRSFSGEIPAPVTPGEGRITVSEFRRGNALSNWEATLERDGAKVARAALVVGRARPADADVSAAGAPNPPGSWSDAQVLDMGVPGAPEFARHFEFRPLRGFPFSGSEEATCEGWIRSQVPGKVLGGAELVAYADAWWPVLLAKETRPRPIGTVAFTLQLLATAELDPQVPLFHRAKTVCIHQGFAVEFRELWSIPKAGVTPTLVALNQQTIAIIK